MNDSDVPDGVSIELGVRDDDVSNVRSMMVSVRAAGDSEEMLAQIADVCRWYALGGPPTGQRQAAALAELAHITGGRTDLLARYAGQSLACHDAGLGDTVHERAAQLCVTAGADMDLIDCWRRESRPHSVTRNGQATYDLLRSVATTSQAFVWIYSLPILGGHN